MSGISDDGEIELDDGDLEYGYDDWKWKPRLFLMICIIFCCIMKI
jgi:hypothetical protein